MTPINFLLVKSQNLTDDRGLLIDDFFNDDFFNDDKDDNDLLEETIGYELIFRPPWAGALSRTLFGWNPGSAKNAQLTTKIPGISSVASISNLCEEVNGTSYPPDSSFPYFCFTGVDNEWTQLVNGVPGETRRSSFPSMRSTCIDLGGKPFGANGGFCALEGPWTQLYSRVPGNSVMSSSDSSELDKICSLIDGTSFGSGDDRFCAVKGCYSQFSTRLPGDTFAYKYGSMREVCDTSLGGRAFGTFCIVEGVWAQLSGQLPFYGTRISMQGTCDFVDGVSFGDYYYCAVKGVWTQLTTMVPGAVTSTRSFDIYECMYLNGTTWSKYCAVRGPFTQLTTEVPGFDPVSSPPQFDYSVCNNLGGQLFPNVGMWGAYCGVSGNYTQFSASMVGHLDDSSEQDIKSACASVNGSMESWRSFCFVNGSTPILASSAASSASVTSQCGVLISLVIGFAVFYLLYS